MSEKKLDDITKIIIGSSYKVSNALGTGFLEKVYENSLSHEMRKAGLFVENQKKLQVYYDNIIVGDYVADLIVENQVLIELKVVRALNEAHFTQCLNYLKTTKLKLGLLLNFGTRRIEIKRIIN